MKTKFTHLISFVIIISLFTNCNNDDDNNTNNHLIVDGSSYNLSQGTAEYYPDFFAEGVDDRFNIDLTFFSSGFTINEEGYYTGEGGGQGIYFEMFSPTTNKLANGTYNYSVSEDPFTFDVGSFFESSETGMLLQSIEVVDGEIIIKNSENDYYELTFECVDAEGKIIEGEYKGGVGFFVRE